jgi:hypothetical protein
MGLQLVYCVGASVPDSWSLVWKPFPTLRPCLTSSFAT